MPYILFELKSCCLVVRAKITNPGVPDSKPLGGSKVDLAFHPSEVDQISANYSRGLTC